VPGVAGRLNVTAPTRSEGRAMAKQFLDIPRKGRLPIGTVGVKLR
jgi:hypothetical protein